MLVRKVFLVIVLVAGCAAVSIPTGAPGARAAAATSARVAQKQSGIASGVASFLVSASQPGLFSETDTGSYALNGQLGRGRYRFDLSFDPGNSGCEHPADVSRAVGAARMVRSDGVALTGTVKAVERCDGAGGIPTTLTVDLTKGSRDLVGAQLTFRGTLSGIVVSGPETDRGVGAFTVTGTSSAATRVGYWMLDWHGTVHAFGGATWMGNASTLSAIDLEPTPTGNGYWIVDSLGRVSAFGDAHWYGNVDRAFLAPGELITSISASRSGHGYWVFTDRGRAQAFGDTKDYGDLHALTLRDQVVGSAVTPTGAGYYMVALDGGVFTFGDARFRGSMGGSHLNLPVVGLVPTADNGGYWLVAADGGVFAFNARFLGSMGRVPLNQPIVGMAAYGSGYMMVAQDGGIFDFSNAPFFGSLGGSALALPIVAVATVGVTRLLQ
jgi:hypothetical protein